MTTTDLGTMYTLRKVAELIGGTDPRTVHVKLAQNGIPTGRAGNSILIDAAGLKKIKRVYANERATSRAAKSA